MNRCNDFACQYIDYLTGYCNLTACCKPRTITYINDNCLITKTWQDLANESLVFPHTIGDITYYSKKELIKWVEDQQKINKDPNYGIGNWC